MSQTLALRRQPAENPTRVQRILDHFHVPIQVTFRFKKGATLSDNDLRRAWHHVPTDRLEAMADMLDLPGVMATRRRALELRRLDEGAQDG